MATSSRAALAMPSFYEFFSGAGMARAGLGEGWACLFANDFDVKKSQIYRINWRQPDVLKTADVGTLEIANLPGQADLVWASFPCQDLSLAGAGAGLHGDRSGAFWPFWELMEDLIEADRAPTAIVLENVCGTLTSHNGKDFSAICTAFSGVGYRVGALVMDAVHFLPQSRPRLFIVGVREDVEIAPDLLSERPSSLWHPRNLIGAHTKLPREIQAKWVWWNLAVPPKRSIKFSDLIEDDPLGVEWHTAAETKKLLKMMSKINLEKVQEAKRTGRYMVGGVYKRTRLDDDGQKVQRAEVRFDDISGCLRTPAGGSSRQVILVVDGDFVRSRLISPRETARLMGLPDSYKLPSNYNEAYHLTGDGVAVPVVRYLARQIIEPLIDLQRNLARAAA
jgi:DNA (cytosine-5)-methyltransferase 1